MQARVHAGTFLRSASFRHFLLTVALGALDGVGHVRSGFELLKRSTSDTG